MENEKSCLFIGRFQPFHKGHLLVVQGMAKVCKKIVIAIGSCEESDTAENPFSADERRDMIQRALQGVDIIPKHDVNFINIPDIKSDEEWADKVLELSGPISKLWTGNDWTKKCFEGKGIDVQDIKEVPGISATEVRKRIKEGGDWKDLVPNEVTAFIVSIDGDKRIK